MGNEATRELDAAATRTVAQGAGALSTLTAGVPVHAATRMQSLQSASVSADRSKPIEVPGFELQGELGQGGMGIVYRAIDVELQRPVAVKILKEQYAAGSVTAERFLEEARITGQLQHPGIPAVHRVGTLEDGRPFLAMKLIRGRTLAELIHDQATFNVLGIFEQIAQAVGFAHSNGVIHRDLKPANVMVGAFGEVQVMDWGLAKHLMCPVGPARGTMTRSDVNIDRGDSAEMTRDGHVIGTAAFMAPEQARGAGHEVGIPADVFGLGAVLCTMLTGRPPFLGEDWESTRQLAAAGRTEAALDLLNDVAAEPELVTLCKRCLAVNPDDRPADGAAVAECVAGLRAATEERARTAEVERARGEVRSAEQRKRRRVVTLAAQAVAAACLVGGLVAAGQWRQKSAAFEQLKLQEHETHKALDLVTQEQQQLRAERRNTVAALNAMTDDVIQRLFARQQTFSDSEKAFLNKVIELYQQATVNCADTASGRALKAEGHLHVAQLYHRLGSNPEAETHFLQAKALLETLVQEHPTNTEHRRDLATVCSQLGAIYYRTDKHDRAETEYAAACALRAGLFNEGIDDAVLRNDDAMVHNNLAILHRDHQRWPHAEAEYNRAIAAREELLKKSPERMDVRYGLALSRMNLANLYADTGRERDSITMLVSARGTLAELAAKQPENPSFAAGLASMHNNLGVSHRDLGEEDLAQASFEASLAIYRKLAAQYPILSSHKLEAARALNNLAKIALNRGRYDSANDLTQQGFALLEKILKAEPTNAGCRDCLAQNRVTQVRVLLSTRDHSAVKAAVAQMLAAAGAKPGPLYDAAVFHAKAAAITKADESLTVTVREDERRHHLALALIHLKQAVDAGFQDVNALRADATWDDLWKRDAFQEIYEALATKHPAIERAPRPRVTP
jgi:tetratricopeptide (TPR) repeat protein